MTALQHIEKSAGVSVSKLKNAASKLDFTDMGKSYSQHRLGLKDLGKRTKNLNMDRRVGRDMARDDVKGTKKHLKMLISSRGDESKIARGGAEKWMKSRKVHEKINNRTPKKPSYLTNQEWNKVNGTKLKNPSF